MALLKDHQFHDFCKLLNIKGLQPNDPDKKTIEKAFRKLALKTHPDKGGDPIEFRKINDAYNKLIGHAAKIDAIDAEAELSRTSVIIEVSKQAVPKWKEKLKAAYGLPKTSKVNNVMFNGPYYQFSGRGKLTGPIVLVLYEDPEDKVPKILCRCDNYMAWIQEQKMPLHLHVGMDKKVMFDQWRIKSLAEFGFVSLAPGHSSARHDWKDGSSNSNYNNKQKEEKERAAREKAAKEAEAKRKAEEQKRKEEEEARLKAEEEARKKQEEEDKMHQPWWQKYADKYQGPSSFSMGETTPPPEDDFPKVYNMTSNSFQQGGTKETNGKQEEDISKEEEPPVKIAKEEPKVVQPEEPKLSKAEYKPQPEPATSAKVEPTTPKVEPATPKVERRAKTEQEDVKPPQVKQEVLPEVPKEEPILVKEEVVAPPEEVKVPDVPMAEPLSSQENVKMDGPSDVPAVPVQTQEKVEEKSVFCEPEIQQAKVINTEDAVPKAEAETEVKPKPSEGKKSLSGLAEKMLSKSKVKKVKTKKAVVKKSSKVEPPANEEEKENQGQQQEEVKMEDVKATNTRKRPLEDIDVEDTKSQGQQGKRANDHSTVEARGLSEDMELDNMTTKTEKLPSPSQINNTDAEKDQQLPMDVTNVNNEHDLSFEDSPDLLKTLKTVKAIKKSLMKSPKILTKKDHQTPSKKKSNTTIIGPQPPPPPDPSATQMSTSPLSNAEESCSSHAIPLSATNNCQNSVVNSSAKEDGDPQQLPTTAPVSPITAKTASADDGKADKEEHSFTENMSVCSDTPSKQSKEQEEGEVTFVGERAEVANTTSESGQVSTCQETNNYSLSYTAAASAATTTNSSTSQQLQPASRNASDFSEKVLDSTQNDLECKEEKRQDNHVNDPSNNRQQTDIIATTPQQDIATPQNRPSISPDTNDTFQKKKEDSADLKDSGSKCVGRNDDQQRVEDAMTKIEVVADELKNLDFVPNVKKERPLLNTKIQDLKDNKSKSRSESPLMKERRRKKSESLEKAEQWLKDRIDQKAKASHSRKTSEHSLPGTDQQKQGNCQETHSSTNKSAEDEKVIPESIPLVTQVTQTISQQQLQHLPPPAPPSSSIEPVVNKTHWLETDLENELNSPPIVNVMRAFSPPVEVPTRNHSPPPTSRSNTTRSMSPPLGNNNQTTIPSRFRNMWQNSKTERMQPPVSKESSLSRRSSVSKESSVPRRGSVFDHANNQGSNSNRSSGIDQLSRRGSVMDISSRFNTPFQSRAPSPSNKSRATSPDSNNPRGKPFYSPTKMATVVTSTDVLSRAKSINQLHEQANASRRQSTTSNGQTESRSKSLSNETASAFNKRGAADSNTEKRPVKEFSPVILVRPSTFIQAMNPPPSPQAKPKDYVNAPPRDRSNQDRIPSRFRKAMSMNSNMTRSRSIHELADQSLENHAHSLQDQIRQARAEHRKFFDDAQSHTTYTSNNRARERISAEWNRTSSMRNLRASPSLDYRRL